MRVLVVRFSAIGDCIMTAWAVTALRIAEPDARIVWAVQGRCAPVIDTDRLVDRVHVFHRERWKSRSWSLGNWREIVIAYTALRSERFDVGFDFQGHSKTALCLALAGCRRRYASLATDPLARALTAPRHSTPIHHEVERCRALISLHRPVGLPDRPFVPEVSNEARELVDRGFLVEPYLSIQTGAGEIGKRYPPERWTEVARRLVKAGRRVVVIGGKGDPRVAVDGTIDLVGTLTLRESLAVVAGSEVHLAADTGTGHAAAAYGVPVVSVFGRHSPDRFQPWTSVGRVLARGSDPAAVEPGEVVEAALELEGAARALPR